MDQLEQIQSQSWDDNDNNNYQLSNMHIINHAEWWYSM